MDKDRRAIVANLIYLPPIIRVAEYKMSSLRRRGLSKPILTTLYACEGNSFTLYKLLKLLKKTVTRCAGKRARYLSPYYFFAGTKGKMRFTKQLLKFVERGIVHVDDLQSLKNFALEGSKEKFSEIWHTYLKNISLRIDQKKLIALSPEQEPIKELAWRLLLERKAASVGIALTLAKKKLKAHSAYASRNSIAKQSIKPV